MRCFRCTRKGVVELRYSGHWLCKKHFLELFEKRVKKTVRQNRLLGKNDTVLVGLSGGKDSLTALKMLNDIISRNPKQKLVALSVDEGIRCKSLRKAVKYCGINGIEHHLTSFKEHFGFTIDDVMKDADGVLACSICGVLKRRVLNDHAKKLKADKVATGHNLDDEIQGGFMNIVRGDLQRMARLGPEVGVSRHKGFVPRIKPLRECPEEEVKYYADFMELPYTRIRCPYSKSSFRTTAKELLNELEERHPGSKYQMLRSMDEFSAVMKERQRRQKPGACVICGEPASGKKCKVCLLLEKLK